MTVVLSGERDVLRQVSWTVYSVLADWLVYMLRK